VPGLFRNSYRKRQIPMSRFATSGSTLTCLLSLVPLYTAPAGGAPITFAFTGTVQTVFDGLGALDSSVEVEGEFVGSYTFDAETVNTAPPFDEGQTGLYHHDVPPAGVRVRVGHFTFRSAPSRPDFDIIVNDEVGFAGADEYGFVSRNNEAMGLLTTVPIGRLDVDWMASTIRNNAIDGTSLPTVPPDLELLGGGLSRIEGECTLCAGPAAFFRIEGTLDSLVRIVLGDMDDDGEVGGLDVDPFVDVLLASRFDVAADMNGDGVVNGLDVDPFVAAVIGGGVQQIPEPSTLLLCINALGVVGGWWRWSGCRRAVDVL
jgi:hypothetical protein